MAPGDVVPEKQPKSKEKRPGNRASKAEYEPDGSYVFEAREAWKDFHNSLKHFHEVGELCDVTLKVGHSSLLSAKCSKVGDEDFVWSSHFWNLSWPGN